jgi:DNA sulfur modification protein DndB
MNLYPAIRSRMGRWNYFVVKMNMREVAENVRFASDVYEDRTLDEAIQREINESRVKKEIVEYLKHQPDRFFSSLVVAALKGNPKWYPIVVADDERFAIFADDERLNDTFGVLAFDGSQVYYALDGQHRLSAIQTLVDRTTDDWRDAPDGFSDEEVSVIVVTPSDEEGREDFLVRYRRLFGNLNRYAKPTSKVTNIIMDEDDLFAILTRRLLVDHRFFTAPGKHSESPRIKTKGGKGVRSSMPFFTSLETLYAMNQILLTSQERENTEWSDEKVFKQFRPSDEKLDEHYEELATIWDALATVLPDLENDPPAMRCHDEQADECEDSALFWPITQELIARIARRLMDERTGSAAAKLATLGKLEMSLHQAPWRHLVLIPDGGGSWKMRSEDRKQAINVVEQILWWQLGLVALNTEELGDLRHSWELLLLPNLSATELEGLWETVESGRVA